MFVKIVINFDRRSGAARPADLLSSQTHRPPVNEHPEAQCLPACNRSRIGLWPGRSRRSRGRAGKCGPGANSPTRMRRYRCTSNPIILAVHKITGFPMSNWEILRCMRISCGRLAGTALRHNGQSQPRFVQSCHFYATSAGIPLCNGFAQAQGVGFHCRQIIALFGRACTGFKRHGLNSHFAKAVGHGSAAGLLPKS